MSHGCSAQDERSSYQLSHLQSQPLLRAPSRLSARWLPSAASSALRERCAAVTLALPYPYTLLLLYSFHKLLLHVTAALGAGVNSGTHPQALARDRPLHVTNGVAAWRTREWPSLPASKSVRSTNPK